MSVVSLTQAQTLALIQVMDAHYGNVLDTRAETGDEEYDQTDEDQCSVLLFMLSDFDYDAETVASVSHLFEAIANALETRDAFPDVDFEALESAALAIGYWEDGS